MPEGTDLSAITPVVVHTGTAVTINGTDFTGSDSFDFTNSKTEPLPLVVTNSNFDLRTEYKVTITAKAHSELYIQATVNETPYEAVMYTPDKVQVEHKGFGGELMGCMSREIKTFFDLDNAPFSKMVLGEVLNLPGKWSSYPPHHHPQPEVYFYRFDYPDGFGAGFANGEIFKTQHNGCAVINHGFHSQTAAPGYAMCYAWGIRHLDGDPWDKTRIDDPEHAWLWKADANDHIYPNH